MVWPVYGYDHGLAESLRAAGFTAEPERAVLVCPIGTDRPDRPDRVDETQVRTRSAATGPHRRSYAEFVADGSLLDLSAEVAFDNAGNAAWGQAIGEFMVLGGVTDPGFATALAARDWRNPQRPAGWRHPDVQFLLVEATGGLDWHHVGYRFDPARVGGTGPRWPGAVFPGGDYYIHLTRDLRLGTFGHPWEETVFGDLLTLIDAELTAALGPPIRRSEP